MDRDETLFALRQELADLRRERDEQRALDDRRLVTIEAAIGEVEDRIAEIARANTRALAAALRPIVPAGGKPAAKPAGGPRPGGKPENGGEDQPGAADPGKAAKPAPEPPGAEPPQAGARRRAVSHHGGLVRVRHE